MYDEFIVWLKDVMQRKNINQSELARRCGFTPASVSRWLNGTRKITLSNAVDALYELGYHIVFVEDKQNA